MAALRRTRGQREFGAVTDLHIIQSKRKGDIPERARGRRQQRNAREKNKRERERGGVAGQPARGKRRKKKET